MRINYNFPYYQERLSPRQKARMAAESKSQNPVIRMELQTPSTLKIRTPGMSPSESIETQKEAGGFDQI